jgi:hypothetical protein
MTNVLSGTKGKEDWLVMTLGVTQLIELNQQCRVP